ncbi:MAG: TRAP transporter large permease subunit, partial [Desulfovibrionaceae bacterium]|nr:TRAP transporter large permease subunit [Desulfovibrionaceae bacterium]
MEFLHDPTFWLLALFLVPLLLRVPICVALGFAAIMVVWYWDKGLSMLSYNFFAGIAKPPLLAIPFFILAGFIMERAGIAKSIINFVQAVTGAVTGGLAVVAVAVATFWGAVSGSGPATVAALGLILIPGMAEAGYKKSFAAATVSVSSGLAIVIPPSIAFIVYGGIANVSVPALFAAGILPGILVAGFIMVAVYLISRKHGYHGRASHLSLWQAFKEAFWGLMTPVVILGGIYGGIFTPTEAAAVAVFYGLFVGVFINRELRSLRDLLDILQISMRSTAVVMIVVTCAGLFSWVATDVGLVEKSSAFLLSLSS